MDEKLKQACLRIVESLSDADFSDANIVKSEETVEKFDYDVFISYSHKNPAEAESMLKMFRELDPELKVFYDRSELVTGKS